MSTVIQEIPEAPELLTSDGLYEIVNGKVVEKKMGLYEVHVLNLLDLFLGRFAFDNQLGNVESEMLFKLSENSGTQRRPDIAFISYQKWPKGRKYPSSNAFTIVPDLMIEVVSPTNFANEVDEKVVEYLNAGVRMVWVVYPTTSRVYVHESLTSVKVITRTGELDGGDVLPGFRLSLDQIFEDETETV
jgi:Uma2 family endonuclease